MSISAVGKFWLALLLLVSSLSSAPMASMEQSVPDAFGQVAQGHPLPPVRIAGSVKAADGSVIPERSAPPHAPQSLSPYPASIGLTLCPALPHGAQRPRPADPEVVVPLCERLPYHANAPPA